MLTSSLAGTSAGSGTGATSADVDLGSQWFINCSTSGYDERQSLLAVWFRVWSGAERLMCLVTLLDTMTHAEMICMRNVIQLRLQHKTSAVIQEANANTVEFVNDGVSTTEATSIDKNQHHQQQQPLLMVTESNPPLSAVSTSGSCTENDSISTQLPSCLSAAESALTSCQRRSSNSSNSSWSCVPFLLDNMPLLSPMSHECRSLYVVACVRAVEAVLQAGAAGLAVEAEQLEGVRQLLALLAVHPALTRDDRCALSELYSRYGALHLSYSNNNDDTTVTTTTNNSTTDSSYTAAVSATSQNTIEDCVEHCHLLANTVTDTVIGGSGLERRRHSACAAIGSHGWLGALGSTHEERRSGLSRRAPAAFGTPTSIGRKNLLSPYDAEEAGGDGRFRPTRANSLTPPSATSSPGSDRSSLANHSPRQTLSMLQTRSCSITSDLKQHPQRSSHFLSKSARSSYDANASPMTCHPPRGGPVLSPRSRTPPHRSSSHSNLSDISRDRAFSTRGSGMTTVPKWLHKLRLHKYTWLFAPLSYRQMLDVSVDWLVQLGVTQGAANKLVRSINQLQHIRRNLTELHQGLIDGSMSLFTTLESMEVIVVSPMLPNTQLHSVMTEPISTPLSNNNNNSSNSSNSDGNMGVCGFGNGSTPAVCLDLDEHPINFKQQQQQQISEQDCDSTLPDTQTLCTQVLGRLCTRLLMLYAGACGMVESGGGGGGCPPGGQEQREDLVQRVLRLLDEATWQEAFSDAQRRKFVTWKRQIAAELGRHTTFPPVYHRSSLEPRAPFFNQRRYSDVHIGSGARRCTGTVAPNYRERPGLLPTPLMNGPSMAPWAHHNNNNNNKNSNNASFSRPRGRASRAGAPVQAPVRSMSGSMGLAPLGSSALAPRSLIGSSRRTSLQEGLMTRPMDTWGRPSAFTRPPPAVDIYRHPSPLNHHALSSAPPPLPPSSSSLLSSPSSSSVAAAATHEQNNDVRQRNNTDIPYICRSVFDNVIS